MNWNSTRHSRIIVFIIVAVAALGVQSLLAADSTSVEQRLAALETAIKAAPTPSPIVAGDNAWLLASSALVLMMTAPGLILFYGGLVRSKNVLATMMHSLVLMAIVSAIWMVYGYSLAFAEGNKFFGNPFTHLFLKGVGGEPNADYAPRFPTKHLCYSK